MNKHLIYPRSGDPNTVYIKNVITRPEITAGDFSMYNDHAQDPRDFEKHNVLYQYPANCDQLIIGKFCSIACGAKFLLNSANHALQSLSTYPFPIFFEEWQQQPKDVRDAGGVPARELRLRFPEETIAELLTLKWWDWPIELIQSNLAALQSGDIRRLKAACPHQTHI